MKTYNIFYEKITKGIDYLSQFGINTKKIKIIRANYNIDLKRCETDDESIQEDYKNGYISCYLTGLGGHATNVYSLTQKGVKYIEERL